MDYDLYYLNSGNIYTIHFPNNKGLSINEVNTVFSAFGKVVNVNNRGDVNGLCFVKYGSLKEVEQAIDGLKNHLWIKILPQKSKMKKTNPKGPTKENSLCVAKKSTYKNSTPKLMDSFSHNGPGSDTNSVCSMKSFKTEMDISNMLFAQYNNGSRKSSIVSSSPNFQTHITEPNDIPNNDEIPPLVFSGSTRGNNVLSTTTSNSSLSPKAIVLPAAEIIVANINSQFGIHYILHLFEKYKPIAASLIKTTQKTAVRYCHVYFKTQKEAMATETEFDHYHLSGNSLIVLRPGKLKYEANLP